MLSDRILEEDNGRKITELKYLKKKYPSFKRNRKNPFDNFKFCKSYFLDNPINSIFAENTNQNTFLLQTIIFLYAL